MWYSFFLNVCLNSVILFLNCISYISFLALIRHMKVSYKFSNICTVIISGLDLSGDCDPFWSDRVVVFGFSSHKD